MNRFERHTYKKSLEAAQEALAEADKFRLPPEKSEPVWRTRDGRTIKVREMKDDHLMNTLAYCQRTGFFKNRVGYLKIEARRRGLV